MPPAPLPPNEVARLAALASLEILDTPAEQVFDSFVRVARELAGTPIAAVSLVAEDRQWFKAISGLPGVTETTRDVSFCAHAILQPDDVLQVPDATLDPRFHDNPLVTGNPCIRFYAGAPLVDEEGHAFGALCVIDRVPRELPPETLARLADVARGVSAALRLHGALRQLDAQARHDPLTGLANRRAFDACLAAPVGTAGLTLLLLDLDRFKDTNDTLGHPAGDATLRETANRLAQVARRADTVYRIGGDEFALVLPEALSEQDVIRLGTRIHGALADTFTVEGTVVPLRTSIGAAVTVDQTRGPASALVPLADRALYEAKRAGRGNTRVHRFDKDDGAARFVARQGVQRMDLETRLRRALTSGTAEPFTLAFQPVVDLTAAKVSSLEALVRWSPEPGFSVSPGEFVPLAERTGLAPHLDRWVLRTACAEAARWAGDWAVAVNISAVTFALADVPSMVRDAMEAAKLPPRRLVIEMTETALAADEALVERAVAGLRSMGIRVALDDFGGGHASLLALRRYPFTNVKADRALVTNLDRDPVGQRTLAFLAEISTLLNMGVVAEGVETMGELRAVRDAGVTRGQGFFMSRPVTAQDVSRAVTAAEAAAGDALGMEACSLA